MNKVASRSGCDDEPEGNEIQQVVEDLYQDYKDWEEAKGQVKKQSLEKLKEGQNAAEVIRCKSLGLMMEKENGSNSKKKILNQGLKNRNQV